MPRTDTETPPVSPCCAGRPCAYANSLMTLVMALADTPGVLPVERHLAAWSALLWALLAHVTESIACAARSTREKPGTLSETARVLGTPHLSE
jgi:hypothetical protein